jgi:hypothetical protein
MECGRAGIRIGIEVQARLGFRGLNEYSHDTSTTLLEPKLR